MFDQPIIIRVTEQKCIGYGTHRGHFASIVRSVGIDTDGKYWTWDTASWTNDGGYDQMETLHNTYRPAAPESPASE